MTDFVQLSNDTMADAEDVLFNFNILGLKHPVVAATTAALPANTRALNVLTANANGALAAQDGITLSVNDSLFVKDEATGANRGLYIVTSLGAAGAPWVLTRRNDANSSDSISNGMVFLVRKGTQAGWWYMSNDAPPTLNTTALTFVQLPPLASPAFTGTPTAPTAARSTSTTQLATTAFVQAVEATDFALTDAATIAISWLNGNTQYVASMAGNRTLTFADPRAGATYTLILTADASSRTPTYPSVTWLQAAPGALAASKARLHRLTYSNGVYYGLWNDQP